MKKYGKIKEYDGYAGKIIDNKGEIYIFTNNDTKEKNLKKNNLVVFKGEVYKTIELIERRARFVRKVTDYDECEFK